MPDVVRLATRPQILNQQLIALLEETLERARSGEIVAVAMAAILADGEAQGMAAETDDRIKLIGAVALLQHDLME